MGGCETVDELEESTKQTEEMDYTLNLENAENEMIDIVEQVSTDLANRELDSESLEI